MAPMTEPEYQALRLTFPWNQHLTTQRGLRGGIVKMLDRNGAEVPLFTMTRFIEYLTNRLQPRAAAPVAPTSPTTPQETSA